MPGIKSTILSGSASWMSSKHSVSGMEISIDFGSRFPGLDQPTVQYSASSSAGEVVSAEMAGNQLKLTVLREGVVAVSVTGQDQSGSQMTDRFEVYVTKVGDITGDGLITPADSLYIQQVIKGTIILSPDDLKRLDLNGDGKVTSADTSIVANLYLAQSRGTLVPEYVVTVKDVNEAPIADQVIISGTAEVGRVLTGSYRYVDLEGDAEAASSPRWYRGATPDGYGKTEIAGATATTYTVQAEDAGGFLFFAVMPGAATGTADGTAVVSSASSLIPIPDTQAPTLIGTAPTPGAAGVAATEALTLTFSEPVAAVAGKKLLIFRTADNGLELSCDVGDASHVTVASGTVTVASPGLTSGTAYYVQVEAGAFQDAAGNPFAGISDPTAWSFTMQDTVAPALTGMWPVAGETDVITGVTPTLTFSENVSAVAGKKITFHLASDDSIVAAYDAADMLRVSAHGHTVVLGNPSLSSGTAYYIQVEAGAFRDDAGNPFAGITGANAWNFTLKDSVAPTLTGTTPLDGATAVAPGAPITFAFSEPVSGVSGRAITIHRASDNAIVDLFDAADTARVVVAGQSVMLASAGLATDTAYYVQVEAGAFQDAAGNLFAGIDGAVAWEFTTVDTMAPTVTDLAPTAASPVPAGVTPAITFSEAVSAVTGKKITFHLAGDNSVVATYAYDAADATHVTVTGRTVTLANPGLISGTAYYIQVEAGAFQDAAGNPFDGIGGSTGWSFTTAVNLSLTALPEAGPLTEINLDGAVVMLFADGGIWNEGVTADHFQLNNAPPGTSIIGAIYMGDQVWVQLTQDGTDFDGGVMNMTVTAKPGAFQGGGQEVTSNPLTVDAVVEQPSAYISEYLNSGGQRSGFEVFFPATPEGSSIYTVEVHQWISATSSKRIVPITLNTTPITWPGFTYVVIESRWYSFFDEPGIPATYYNDELAFADSGAVVQALVLKKNGQVIDTLGDTSNRYAPLLAWGGTLVRRSSVIGGSNVYRPNQWTSYPAETFGYFGKHRQY